MQILQVSAYDQGGGAETVAMNLHREYQDAGHDAAMAVGFRHSTMQNVVEIPNHASRSRWWRLCHQVEDAASRRQIPIAPQLASWFSLLDSAERERYLYRRNGGEDFSYPGTARLLDLTPGRPQIVHCHNLHGYYFDLRLLPWLSAQVPVVLTLHDAWLFSGHCSHSFDCERWKTGCGECPDLGISYAIPKDATASNWKVKARIFERSRLRIVTPSRWLMNKVEQSMLQPAVVEARVIPNGVDLSIYQPGDRQAAREALGIPQDARVLLCTALGIRKNPFKDFKTMRQAVSLIAERMPESSVIFLALGESAPTETVGNARIQFVPYQKDPSVVARYYQAAEVYIHPSLSDTFPNVILEAQACGCPVVATRVGGIPEQIEHGKTGFLVNQSSPAELAEFTVELLTDGGLRRSIRAEALAGVRLNNDWRHIANKYLTWFEEITANA